MKPKIIVFAGLIAIAGVLLGSCQNEAEEHRAVVTIASINGNQPYFSDVLEQGDTLWVPPLNVLPFTSDDFVREDWITVLFDNRPYSPLLTTGPGLPLSDFIITDYRVEWRRTDGGVGVPPTYYGATSISVPSGEQVFGAIVLVPYEVKNSPLMSTINYLGATFPDEYLMIATLTFYGHEVGAMDREWSFSGQISVNFADPVVITEKDE
ncbi:MAG: hypothetical protein OEN01_14085 [Candidatus Krumholzibacteria bacterium]|nr:hypothetical protein [Candidatus Krumholzibacteria bacterium]